MGDSGRRRGSMRDVVDEDLPCYTNRGRYREYSDLPHNNILKPRGHSRWSSWEEKGGPVVKDKNDDAETREQLHNNSYYRSMSPDFDGLEQQKWSNAPDKQWSQPRRYGERRRSSSRGMEKSRSRSPGWSRGGNRTRNWSRSRSRSRSKGSIRGHSRSRSPFYDHGLESHRWSDRKSSRGISSQTCKDFLSGMCRRGSQCRFPHSDNILRDDERLDSDIGGRWKGKQEPGHGSRFHYDKAADKFSDVYHGENDPSRNRPRGAITCRDFVKGNCRFGESCRFSHSVENDNVDRSFKNVSVDPDHGHNSKKSGRALCKFFLAGNCRRDNCRFSHDTPLSGEREDRIHEKVGGEPEDTLDEWKGPVWDAAEKPANTRKISRWGASVDADLNLSGDVSLGRRGDERWGHSLEDEAMGWEHNKSLNTDNYHANNRENEETSRRTDSNFIVTEKSRGEPQQNRSYDDFRSHSLDKLAPHIPNHNLGEQQQNRTYEEFRSHSLDKLAPHIPNHNIGEPQQNRTYEEFRSHSLEKLSPHIPNRNHGREAAQHYLSSASENPHVSMAPATHQYQGMEEHNRGPALESGDLYERKDFRNTNGQSVNPEIRSPFCDNSSLSNMKGQRMLSPLSNALKVDLNESGSGHVTFPSNEDFQINRQQSTIHHMPEPSAHSSFPVQTPSDKFAPLNTLPNSVSNAQTIPIHVAKSLLNELQTQLNTVLEPSTFLTIAPSQSLHRPVPVDYQQNISNSTMSLDQHPRTKNDTFYAANDQKARELLSSLSMIDPHLSTLHHSSDLKVVGNDDSEENQPEAVKELEVNDNGDKVNMSSQIEADNICSNRADDQGKEEGGLNNKDEKVIRLFKNALVELVKDILKPKWKEGKMSREVHKTVVKKVVDKVTVTIPAEHVPKTQEKIEQYLSSNRPKITKLAQAYVERSLKAGS